MFYDLGGDIVINVNGKLAEELSNFFNKRSSLFGIKVIIECQITETGNVSAEYNDSLFIFNRQNWVAQLFQKLPEIFFETYPNFLFLHGSCFSCNNNIVLLLGHSKSGKSTALYNVFLDNRIKCKYVSDEIIAIEPTKKYILPLSNKPIQLREDVVSHKNHYFVNDAWNMKKITFFCPQIKESNCLYFNEHRLLVFFIKYCENSEFQVNPICGYDLVNSLFRCCFNISKISHDVIANIATKNMKAISLIYDGNIEKLFEVIS